MISYQNDQPHSRLSYEKPDQWKLKVKSKHRTCSLVALLVLFTLIHEKWPATGSLLAFFPCMQREKGCLRILFLRG